MTKPTEGGARPPLSSFMKTPIAPAPAVEPVPGEETAMIPAKPTIAPEGQAAGPGDPLKILPNALKDVGVILKEGTFGTAKRIAYDIPKEAIGLAKERGLGAVLDFEKAVPGEIVKMLYGFIPQSAKELANIDSIQKIPAEFQALAKESGGYWEALKKVSKEIPGSILPGLKQYTRQVDRARRGFINHPVYEALGYLALKGVVENPAAFAQHTKESVKTTGEFTRHPIKSTTEAAADATRIFQEKVAEPMRQKAQNDIANAYRETAGGTIKSRKQLARSEARGKDPAQVLGERNITPKVEDGKMNTLEGQAKLDAEAKPLNNHLELALDEIDKGGPKLKLETARSRALAGAGKIRNITETARDQIRNAINKEFDLNIEKYGPEVTRVQLNHIKKANWGETKFDITKPYQTDANYQIGRAAKDIITESVPKESFGVNELNDYVGNLYDAKKFLSTLEGHVVKGGRLGRYAARGVGAVTGLAFPFPGGSILGILGGDVIAQILQQRTFSTPLKQIFLKNLKKYEPPAYQQALQFIEKTQAERLTRPLLGPAKTIQLGPKKEAPKMEGSMVITTGKKPPATYEEGVALQAAQQAAQAEIQGKVSEYRATRKAAGQKPQPRTKLLEKILPPKKPATKPAPAGKQVLRYSEKVIQPVIKAVSKTKTPSRRYTK